MINPISRAYGLVVRALKHPLMLLGFNASGGATRQWMAQTTYRSRLAPKVVGPPGVEPGTKGFSRTAAFPRRLDYVFTRSLEGWEGGGGCCGH